MNDNDFRPPHIATQYNLVHFYFIHSSTTIPVYSVLPVGNLLLYCLAIRILFSHPDHVYIPITYVERYEEHILLIIILFDFIATSS